MTAQLSPQPVQKFFDNNGAPLANGLLYSYQAGTTNPQATYTDSTEGTPNTNPVVMNARGEANIWLDPTLAYKLILKDSAGNQIWSVDNINGALYPTTSIIPNTNNAYDLGSATNAWRQLYLGPNGVKVLDASGNVGNWIRTAAEIAAGVTPVNYAYAPGDVRRYGAVLDGATNDYQAIYNACKVAAAIPSSGARVLIPGFAAIASASLAAAPLPLGNNTELVGLGRGTSGITITGTSVCYLATVTNPLNIRIADLAITGNSQANASRVGECFQFLSNSSATGNTGNIVIERCTFSNFKGDYWLQFDNLAGTTYSLQNIHVRNNLFVSQAGNARDGTNIGIPSACVMFRGSATNTTGLVRDAWVHDNRADGTYIKTFCVAWESTVNIRASRNALYNFGQSGISLNAGAYALFAYNNSSNDGGPGGADPDQIFFEDNAIYLPLSCGIYTATVNRVYFRRNFVYGQSDTNDGSIPKGAIAVNDALYCEADDNYAEACFAGIEFTPLRATCINKARRNRIYSSVASALGIKFNPGYVGNVDTFEAGENDIVLTGTTSTAMQANVTSTVGLARLSVKDNRRLAATAYCFRLFSPDSSVPNVQYADISRNGIVGAGSGAGPNTGISWTSASNAATRATISGNKYTGTWATAATMLDIRSSTGLTVKDEEFCDLTGGTVGTTAAVSSAGAQGRMEGCRFNNVGINYICISSANFLGGTLPNWTGNANDFVQNLTITEQGTAGSKYVLMGWQWDATNAAWKPARSLTGN